MCEDSQYVLNLGRTGYTTSLHLLQFLTPLVPLHLMFPLVRNHLYHAISNQGEWKCCVRKRLTRLMALAKSRFWAAILLTHLKPAVHSVMVAGSMTIPCCGLAAAGL